MILVLNLLLQQRDDVQGTLHFPDKTITLDTPSFPLSDAYILEASRLRRLDDNIHLTQFSNFVLQL